MGRPKFDAARHPRDRFGRFTKSRTVLASAKDKKAAKQALDGFTLKKVDAQSLARPDHQQAAHNFAFDAKAINEDLRAGHADAAGVKPMDDAMAELGQDLVLSRTVPASAFGGLDVAQLQGMKVRDAGFTTTQLAPAQPSDGVRMHIAAPAGTRGVVNGDTGEVYLDRDLEMVVSKVEPNSAGGHDMYLTVLPKAETVGKVEPDLPEGEDKTRADLMKLKVADLQAQMRERGLKPGKKRKSELVAALVADEHGHEDGKSESGTEKSPDEPDKPATPADTRSFDDRAASALTAQDALDAAPLSLVRQDTHDRLKNRTGFTADQRDALAEYQGTAYKLINGALRDADTPNGRRASDRDAVIDRWTAAIDKAMDGSVLTADAGMWRGAGGGRRMFGDAYDQDMTGLEWRESAYTSTSARKQVSDYFATPPDGILMRVLVPAGAKGVEVSGVHDEAGNLDEAELLLARGYTLRVVSDHGMSAGVRQLDVEVVV